MCFCRRGGRERGGVRWEGGERKNVSLFLSSVSQQKRRKKTHLRPGLADADELVRLHGGVGEGDELRVDADGRELFFGFVGVEWQKEGRWRRRSKKERGERKKNKEEEEEEKQSRQLLDRFCASFSTPQRPSTTSHERATSPPCSSGCRGRGRRRGAEACGRRRRKSGAWKKGGRKKKPSSTGTTEQGANERRLAPLSFISSLSSRSRAERPTLRRRWKGRRIALAVRRGGERQRWRKKGAPRWSFRPCQR